MKVLNVLIGVLLLCLLPLFDFGQKKTGITSVTPCCSILSVGPVDGVTGPDGYGPVDGIVFIRNNSTGQTYFFKPESNKLSLIKKGDPVNADFSSGKITSIKGITTSYPLLEPIGALSPDGVGPVDALKSKPNPGAPCCTISKIEAVPAEPCCGIITVSDHTTGNTYSLHVEQNNQLNSGESIMPKLSVGQPVYMSKSRDVAFFQVDRNGNKATYSYPASASMGSSGTSQAWEILMDSASTGQTGMIALKMPSTIKFMSHLKVFSPENDNPVASWFGNSQYKLMPGNYDVMVEKYRITGVPVEKGKITRLKMGYLNFTARQSVSISDEQGQTFPMAGPFKIALPPGIYHINGKKDQKFTITDGEQTDY
ncbi:MAG: hypothetical protein ACJ75F_11720 [Flavisolibacter sp.]